MIKKKIHSLDKNYSAEIFLKKPDKYNEIEKVSLKFDNIITMGSCNSYAPASFKKDSLSIKLTQFNRILEFDEKNKLITVEAGITLSNLFNFTLQHGLWIPQIPGYPTITIGGAIASNSHGTHASSEANSEASSSHTGGKQSYRASWLVPSM